MSDAENNTQSTVLIVGAGPVGLTLANALVRYGVSVCVVDKKSTPEQDSKALGMNVSSQYGYELLGMRQFLGRCGQRVRRANVLWRGKRISGIEFKRTGFHIDSLLAQPQADTERELFEALEHVGHSVQWRTRVLAVAQQADWVEAVLEDSAGQQITRRFAYAIGCDGKYSVVREQMEVSFSGLDYPMHFILGDFALNWDAARDQVTYHVWDDLFFVMVPIADNRWRVVLKQEGPCSKQDGQFGSQQARQDQSRGEQDKQEIMSVVSSRLGQAVFTGEVFWISRAPFYTRIANRLHQGRLFLAGDSAHLFSPIGGTGMNTGISDALNLAWKLAYSLHGHATPALLESYQTERLEAITVMAAAADLSTRLIACSETDPAQLAIWQPGFSNRKALRHTLPALHSGLGFAYGVADGAADGGAFAGRNGTLLAGSLRAGQLCRALPGLHKLAGNANSAPGLPKLMLVAALADGVAVDSGAAQIFQQLGQLRADYQAVLSALLLAEPACASEWALSGWQIAPAQGGLMQQAGLVAGGMLLIAPDGFVAWSGALHEVDLLRQLLGRLVCNPAQTLIAG